MKPSSVPESSPQAACAALIGDVVDSRKKRDQSQMFEDLRDVFASVSLHVRARQALTLTIGDEFQAVYATLEDALLATTMLRLAATPRLDLRFGIGWGELTRTRSRAAQTGPGWWRAREAIRLAEEFGSSSRWPSSLRTLLVDPDELRAALANAFLVCRDQIISGMDAKDARIALGLLTGERQAEVGQALELPQSSVSRRQRVNGPSALFRAHQMLAHQIELLEAAQRS
jgi:SatD family (SatD)